MFRSNGTSTRVPNLKGSQPAPPTQYQRPKAHEQQASSGGNGLSSPAPSTGSWNKENQQKPYYKPPGPAPGQKGGPKATGISYNYK